MKKTLIFLFALCWIAFCSSSASASCQDIRFSDWNRFCFDIVKVNSSTFEAQTSSVSTSTSLSCTLRLPNNNEISLSNCKGRFTYYGSDIWRIHLRATARTTYEFVAYYDFWNGTFNTNWSSSSYYNNYNSNYNNNYYYYYDYYPEFYSVSDTRPNRDKWIDLTLRVRRNGSSYDYNGRVDFTVEKYSWGSWSRASSYEYDLDRTSYSFSSSDRWEVKFYSLVRFREDWEYRLVAELRDNGATTYETFNVNGYYSNSYSSSSYDAKELSIYSISPSSPGTYQWVDVTVRAIASNGNVAWNYNKRIRFEVQQYKNGSWRTADYSDYDLDKDSYYFSTSDNGRKTFTSLVRFRRTGEYRLKVYEEYNSSIYWTKTIYVGTSSSSYYNSNYYNSNYYYSNYYYSNNNFTDNEIRKIRAIYDIWDNVISSLERDYPNLKRSSAWESRSNTFRSNMRCVLNNNSWCSFRNRSDFYNGFVDWFSYTSRTR